MFEGRRPSVLCASAAALFAASTSAAQTTVRVAEDCRGEARCYESFSEALSVPAEGRLTILVDDGSYREKVFIRRPNVTLRGSGAEQVQLSFNLVARDAGGYHRDGWGTPGSAVLTIDAENVTVEGMTVENTFDHPSNERLRDDDSQKVSDSQAVALFLDTSSDRVLLKNVVLKGYQDTLFAHGKRAYMSGGAVWGHVDFIFGDGQMAFQYVDIVSRPRGKPLPNGSIHSYITAPSTQLHNSYGFLFVGCRLLRDEGVGDSSVALGRPWHPTTTFDDGRYADPNVVGYAAFIDTYMGAHIIPAGWTTMNGTARDGTKTDVFRPEDSRFFERGSTGPGAVPLAPFPTRQKLRDQRPGEEIMADLLGDWRPY